MKKIFYTGAYGDGIFSYIFSPEKIEFYKEFSGVKNPSYLCLSKDKKHLYAVSEFEGGGEVVGFDVDACGVLHENSRMKTAGGYVCHIGCSSGGKHLACAGFESGDIDIYLLDNNGKIIEKIFTDRHIGSSAHPERQESAHAHFVSFCPDNENLLYTCDLGCDRIFVYEITGEKVAKKKEISIPAGNGPRHIIWSKTLPGLFYLVCEISYKYFVIKDDEIIAEGNCLTEGFDDFGGSAAIRINNNQLFISNRIMQEPFGRDCISVFDLGMDGIPKFNRFIPAGYIPRDINIIDNRIVTACQGDSEICLYCGDKIIQKINQKDVCCITDTVEVKE